MDVELLRYEVNINRREYFMKKVNTPLRKACVLLGNRYPEPTKDNLTHPNSLRLLEIRDKFLEYEDNPGRLEMFKAMFKVLIAKHEHSAYYRDRLSWFIEMAVNSGWKPRSYGHPYQCWKEPVPYGGVPLIKK